MVASVALFVAIACLGMFVQSTVGFAGSLVAVPLFALFWAPKEIIPVYVLVQAIVNPFLIWEARKFVQWNIAKFFLVGGIPASYFGVLALQHLPTNSLRLFISAITFTFGLLFLFKISIHFRDTAARKIGIGVLSGFLGGSISESGPPVVLYGLAQNWQKDAMRATLLAYFFFLNLSTVIIQVHKGLITSSHLPYVAWAVPPILVIAQFGILLKNKVSEQLFRKIVLGVILFVSFLGLAHLR